VRCGYYCVGAELPRECQVGRRESVVHDDEPRAGARLSYLAELPESFGHLAAEVEDDDMRMTEIIKSDEIGTIRYMADYRESRLLRETRSKSVAEQSTL
jgi:hypothetical protein